MRAKIDIGNTTESGLLNFKDLLKQGDGVYMAMGYPNSRFIVLNSPSGGSTILFIGDRSIEVAHPGCWANDKFVKLEEQVSVTFKSFSKE